TGTLNANLVEITSVDLETGRERRIEIYDGGLLSYTEDQLTASIYNYAFNIYDNGQDSDGSNIGKLTGSVTLAWTDRAGDPEGQYNARGIAIFTYHDTLFMARATPENPAQAYEMPFYWNRGKQLARVAGPTADGDYSKLWSLQLISSYPRKGRSVYDFPMIEQSIGELNGN